MKNIIVTGGAGFLGSSLCEKLLQDGNRVICVDNFFTGRISNIKDLMADPDFELVECDIENAGDLKKKIMHVLNGSIDAIYNLACPASPPWYQIDPIKTIRTNVIGTMNMLDLATEYRSKILQASTSEVYGDPEVHPQPESYRGNVNPIGVRACYDEGKRCSETLCFDYHRKYGARIKVIRIFNTYGPKMDPKDGRVISNFIMQALAGQPLTVYGKGSQTRSLCYIDDLINGMIKMMEKEDDFIGPVNLGNPHEFSVLELAEKIIRMTNSRSKVVYLPLPSDDPTQRKPVIELARKELNWQPLIMLDEGLSKTIEYYKQYISN